MAVERETSESKIIKEIEKTGLPTEMVTTQILTANGWNVFNEYPYLDSEINQIRTLDIKAYKLIENVALKKPNNIGFFSELYIECKKAQKQTWVFFVTDKAKTAASFSHFKANRFIYGLVKKEDVPSTILMNIPEEFSEIPYKIALSHQVVGGGKDDFFESKMQIVKALQHEDHESDNLTISAKDFVKSPMRWSVVPIIVFDGGLFECYFEKEQIRTCETNYVRCLVYGLPTQKIPILIDVVTLKYFSEYLKSLENHFQTR